MAEELLRARCTAGCLVITAVLMLAACAVSPDAARPASAATATTALTPAPHLVVYGDSISVAANQDRPAPAWPLQVAHALGDPSPAVYGMPSFTAGQITAAVAESGIRTQDATALIIEAGTNDFVMNTPITRFKLDYPALLDAALAAGARPSPHLVCLGVWHRETDGNRMGAMGADYDAIIRQTCWTHGGTYVVMSGLYAAPGNLSPIDHFHPSSAGQAAIAAQVRSVIMA